MLPSHQRIAASSKLQLVRCFSRRKSFLSTARPRHLTRDVRAELIARALHDRVLVQPAATSPLRSNSPDARACFAPANGTTFHCSSTQASSIAIRLHAFRRRIAAIFFYAVLFFISPSRLLIVADIALILSTSSATRDFEKKARCSLAPVLYLRETVCDFARHRVSNFVVLFPLVRA